jgi:hypothetical protein
MLFVISKKEDAHLYGNRIMISVFVINKNKAEVSGLFQDDDDDKSVRNSRWGEAIRSKNDKSCWTCSDFEICAK